MSRGLWPLLIGALAAAGLLPACSSGGGSNTPPVLTPQARPAIESILASVGGAPVLGSPGTYKLTITAKSADGSNITGTYPAPITLSDSDTSGATRLSATSVASSTTTVSLVYNGLRGSTLGGFQGATITATSGSATSQVAFLSSGTTCATFKSIAGYYPCDLQSAYSLPSSTAGTGQTVAIVDAFDDPNAEADLGIYRAQFGLPACTTANRCFKKVNQRGVVGAPPSRDTIGWSGEASLDLDMVSAICPNCHILFVEADSDADDDLGASVDRAAALGATQISLSYGATEYPAQVAQDGHYNHPRSTIVVASGDSNYGVEFPASSPYVTAVGGTNLTVASNSRGWNEFVWNNANVQGAGSGCSMYEPKPSWQHDLGCPQNRMDTDVAAVADPYTAVAIYDSYIVTRMTLGGWAALGGTSAAAPIVAAVYALAGSSAAALDYGSSPYRHPGAFNDVTNGSNGTCAAAVLYFCTAAVGYDGPTGFGTPNGVGGFGGPALTAAGSIRSAQSEGPGAARRHVIQAAVGSPVVRVCSNPEPGHFACNALRVLQ